MNIRKAKYTDNHALYDLYQAVVKSSNGLARTSEEITLNLIDQILQDSIGNGLTLVIEEEQNQILGCIHACSTNIRDLNHIMSQLTILIHPSFQGLGHGKKLFQTFLEEISENYSQVLRVELRARSTNFQALKLYQSLGFEFEGVFRKRIRNKSGVLEDGLPMVWFNPNFKDIYSESPFQFENSLYS